MNFSGQINPQVLQSTNQMRRKQVEEYEEILEENRKLQLEINKLTREKEGISGRLEIARQELKDNTETRRQIIDLEQKLKDKKLDIFKQKQAGSQLELKIQQLIIENRKLSEDAELQLNQNQELMKKTQQAESTLRNAIDAKFMVEKQVKELHVKGNQQQEYLNKVLEKLANTQRENDEMGQKVNMLEQEGLRISSEMRNQQGYAMDLVGKLKTIENEKLILEDKIDKQERLLRQMKEKAERQGIMGREIFNSQQDQAKENGLLVARLEEMNELVEAKNKKIKKMSREIQRIQELVGNQKSEVTQVIQQKEEEIVEVLKMNKQLNEAKKKSKEKKKEKKKDIENTNQQYEERKQKSKEIEHENEKLKKNCKELEETLKKMYEDNSVLFQENNKIKEIIAQFKQNEGSHYQQSMDSHPIIRKQLDEERVINQKNLEQMTHKVSFLQQQEHIKIVQQLKTDQAQMQKLQEKFKINENNYEAQVNQLQFTLNKIQNDNLHIQAHGQHSFETLLRDFEQIQLHNQFLVEQLKEYECKFANLLLMQESFMGNQQCCLPNQSIQLLPIQTNIYTSPPPPQIILNKPHTPNYQTALQRTPQIRSSAPPYQMNSKDDRLNKKIYQRCREIVTQYD